MDPVLISFVAAWIIRHWWDERRRDYRSGDNGYTRMLDNASASGEARPGHRPSGTRPGNKPARTGPEKRYAAGWWLYQLRHGGRPMLADIKAGWRDAKTGYEAWKTEDARPDKPKPAEAAKTAWERAQRPMPPPRWKQKRAAAKTAEKPDSPDAAPDDRVPAPGSQPQPIPLPDPNVVPLFPQGDTMSVEVTGIHSLRVLLDEAIEMATRDVEDASGRVARAEEDIARLEAAAGSLNIAEVGGGVIEHAAAQIEAAMARKEAAENDLQAAEQQLASAQQQLQSLDDDGHTNAEEALRATNGPATKTAWYRD